MSEVRTVSGGTRIRRYSMIAVGAALWIVIVLAFSPRAQWPTMAALTAAMMAIIAGMMIPAVRRAAQARRRVFVWAGVATLILGAGVLAGTLAFPSAIPVEWGADAFCVLLLAGIFLIWLPRMSASTERAVQARKMLAATPVRTDQVNSVSEATAALFDPINQFSSYVKVVGVWLVAFCALPLALESLSGTTRSPAFVRDHAMMLLLALAGLTLAGALILIIAGIRWTRFVATARAPRWGSVPVGALWAWTWRLFVFGSIFRVTQGIEPWLVQRLPGVAPWVLQALSEVAKFAVVVLATPFALSLTAAALGRTAEVAEIRLRILRATRVGMYLGAALVLAPLFVIDWLSDAVSWTHQGPAAQMAGAYAYIVALFLTVTASTGYLARLYAKSE